MESTMVFSGIGILLGTYIGIKMLKKYRTDKQLQCTN